MKDRCLSGIAMMVAGFVCGFIATQVSAATVETVQMDRDIVILKLSSKELESIDVGPVTLRAQGRKIEGEISDISGSKAKVNIVFGIDRLKEGQKVKVTTVGGQKKGNGKVDTGSGRQTTFRDDFDMPFIFLSSLHPEIGGARALQSLFGAQSVRFGNMGGVFAASMGDAKHSEKMDSGKIVVDSEIQNIEGGAYYRAGNIRLGIGAGKQTTKLKVTFKPEAGNSTKQKVEFEDTLISLSAATIFESGAFAGLRLISHDYETMFDSRSAGGDKTEGSESISELQLSAGFADPSYEVVLNYAPPLHIDEDNVFVARPVTWTLNYRRKMAAMDVLAGLYHAYYSALSSEEKNRQGISLGGLWTTGYGSFSALLNYATKYYSEKEYASPFNIAHYGLTLGSRIAIDKHSDVGVVVDFEQGKDKGKDDSGSTTLSETHMAAQISYARYY